MTNIFFDPAELKHCGQNVIIGKAVRIKDPARVSIGDNVIIDDFTYISGDVDIGDYVHIAPNCVLAASDGGIVMEAFSGLSAGCKVYGGSSNYIKCGLDMPTIPSQHRYNVILERCVLRSFALIGANCVILPGCEIPQGAAVAANIVIRKNVELKSWHVLLDDTGKLLRRRGVEELEQRVNQFYKIQLNYDSRN